MSISGPTFGAVLPRRKSLARPWVGTRSSALNDAGECTVNDTTEVLPAGIVPSKKIIPFARALAGRARAAAITAASATLDTRASLRSRD